MILWMVLPPQSEREQRTKAGAENEFQVQVGQSAVTRHTSHTPFFLFKFLTRLFSRFSEIFQDFPRFGPRWLIYPILSYQKRHIVAE